METVKYDWVLARYAPFSDQGKYIMSLVSEGVGYHLLNKERKKGEDVIVAFKFPTRGLLPHHLTLATKNQVARLDELDLKRKGSHRDQSKREAANKIVAMFPGSQVVN